jgi:hypothetical protein
MVPFHVLSKEGVLWVLSFVSPSRDQSLHRALLGLSPALLVVHHLQTGDEDSSPARHCAQRSLLSVLHDRRPPVL